MYKKLKELNIGGTFKSNLCDFVVIEKKKMKQFQLQHMIRLIILNAILMSQVKLKICTPQVI